jgi:ectoine hydroxylase-related dioxygenase (phytanoyl-CoA dioxygenase family)
MRYTADEHRAFADEVLRTSYCLLRDHFASDLIAAWRAAFAPLLERHIEREGRLQNRGPKRYYVTLPFEGAFADPRVFEDPDILAIVELLAGRDFVMCQLATDTPTKGSAYQDLHRDTPPLFPEWHRETPPFQLAVNFPLVDVTLENGPMEAALGTHMLDKEEAMQKIASGEIAVEPVLMRAGDVIVRDVRSIHRGTPNTTDEPRPMVVVGYSRRWLHRPEVSVTVPRKTYEALSERARNMLRFNPVVERLQEEGAEVYQSFAY